MSYKLRSVQSIPSGLFLGSILGVLRGEPSLRAENAVAIVALTSGEGAGGASTGCGCDGHEMEGFRVDIESVG
jgi:hypothetical protein